MENKQVYVVEDYNDCEFWVFSTFDGAKKFLLDYLIENAKSWYGSSDRTADEVLDLVIEDLKNIKDGYIEDVIYTHTGMFVSEN